MSHTNESDIKEVRYGYIRFHLLEAAAHGKAFCWGLCCVQGCIFGIFAMMYFFILLPTASLLILFGTNKGLAWAVVTGAVLLVMSTFGVPALCLLFRYHRRKQRDRRAEYRVERSKAAAAETYVNQATELQDGDNTIHVTEVAT